jgi:hypothetical protein
MGPPGELPGWLQAAGWGALSASGLLIGAAGGYYTEAFHDSPKFNGLLPVVGFSSLLILLTLNR